MNKLPKTLTLKLEVEIDIADIIEYYEEDGKNPDDITIDEMVASLRGKALDQIGYNAIQFAPIFDENNELVGGEE
jgi:hypothetical protein